MKIIQVNVVYGKGSTGRLTLQLHQYFLAQGHDSLVLYGRGQSSTDPKVIKVGSEFSSKVKNLESEWFCKDPLKGSRHSTNQILSYIKAFKPDVILLQCLNGFFLDYYSLLSQISTLKIKTFLVLHAFFPFTGYCGYPFACQQWQKGCSHCQENDPAFRLFFPKRVEKWFLQKQRIYNSFPNLRFIAVSPYLLAKAEDSPLIGFPFN
jgi:putative colanic acid biosynthesis glycosyltransferase